MHRIIGTLLLFGALCSSPLLSAQELWTTISPSDIQRSWKQQGLINTAVEEEVLSLSSANDQEGGWLISPDVYSDFHLKLTYRLTGNGRGKIAFRVPGHQDAPADITGYAVHLSADPVQQNSAGSIIDVSRATWLEEIDYAGWQQLDITAVGDHLRVYQNGIKITETHNRRSAAGQLALSAGADGTLDLKDVSIRRINTEKSSGPMTDDLVRHYPGDYVKLFNGKDLSGWTTTGTSDWKVENGEVLHGYSGADGGFLIHETVCKDFHLKFKFKIKKEDNSGVFIRKPAASENVSIEEAIECNIYDHNNYAHAWSTGALATHARAWWGITDYEDWNSAEIIGYGDHVIMFVNGQKASEAHLPLFDHAGQICLQAGVRLFTDNGPSDIYFKDIFLKVID